MLCVADRGQIREVLVQGDEALIRAVYLRGSSLQPWSVRKYLQNEDRGRVQYHKILGQLKSLRSTGNNRYRAFCPAHDSNSHSLALAVADDGRLLIKCHAGCGALDVLQALGCDWEDCFPEEQKNLRSLAREFDIKPAHTIHDRVVELANHSSQLTAEQVAEAERAALRGGVSDGFCREVARNLPENKQWAEQLLETERELLKAEMMRGQG